VFSPHPDDETLGAGGYLHEARHRGARIQVVYLTTGDGFRLCAAARYRQWPSGDRMRRLATDRRAEALAALGALGLPPDAAVFLGYPDRGLAPLWLTRWGRQQPYRSPFTEERAVPAANTFHPGAPYAGGALLEDVESVLRQFRPTVVLYPDPADDHPDHWAAHCFVQLALERLSKEPWAKTARRSTYLVHRGDWPEPQRLNPALYLSPPAALSGLGAQWEMVSLTPAARDAKARALRAYRSQQVLAGGFLNAFVRRNELLVHWPDAEAPTTTGEVVRPSEPNAFRIPVLLRAPGEPSSESSWGESVLPDPTRDRFARSRCGAVDFTSIEVQRTHEGVRLQAELRDPVAAWPVYELWWKPVQGAAARIRTRRYQITGYRCEPPGARFAIEGNRLQVTIPQSELGDATRILVAASAQSGPVVLDRTPWRVVAIGRP
jgi:LmbE family N-acetylglucosaminyl deacetylase